MATSLINSTKTATVFCSTENLPYRNENTADNPGPAGRFLLWRYPRRYKARMPTRLWGSNSCPRGNRNRPAWRNRSLRTRRWGSGLRITWLYRNTRNLGSFLPPLG